MKILADENIPLTTIRALRERGHDVLDLRGTTDQGMPDDSVWKKAHAEGRLLITTDKSFAQHRDEPHHGILIVRLRKPNRQKIHQRILQALERFTPDQWLDRLVVSRDTVQSTWHKGGAGRQL